MDAETAVGFFRHGTTTLLVRHADPSRGRWDAVSVPADDRDDTANSDRLASAVGDIETTTLVRSGEPIVVGSDGDAAERVIYSYLFECDSRELSFDDSIVAHEWIQPPALLDRETVPGLWEAYLAVAPSVQTVRDDTDHGAGFVSVRALEALRDRATVAATTEEAYDSVAIIARELRRARPSMGVIGVRIDRVMASAERTPESVRNRAILACSDAVRADREAAERAASLLGDRVFTLSRSGTVHSALEAASPESVFVAESRPAREGIDVAERLAETGIDVTVLVDAAMEGLIASGAVDTVLTGADSVLEDGSAINKIGTMTAMRAGRAAGIDSYVVCSRDKIVPGTDFDPEFGPLEAIYEGDADLSVHSPTFERVPAAALTGVVTEGGIHSTVDIRSIAREHASYREWDESDT